MARGSGFWASVSPMLAVEIRLSPFVSLVL